jgi:hypothetical protein
MGKLIGPAIVIIQVALCTALIGLGIYLLVLSFERWSSIVCSALDLNDLEIGRSSWWTLKAIGLICLVVGFLASYFFLIAPLL